MTKTTTWYAGKAKEQAAEDFLHMIERSWTWDRLTDNERQRFQNLLTEAPTAFIVSGTYKHRWEVLESLYTAFLEGCQYAPMGWRDPE